LTFYEFIKIERNSLKSNERLYGGRMRALSSFRDFDHLHFGGENTFLLLIPTALSLMTSWGRWQILSFFLSTKRRSFLPGRLADLLQSPGKKGSPLAIISTQPLLFPYQRLCFSS